MQVSRFKAQGARHKIHDGRRTMDARLLCSLRRLTPFRLSSFPPTLTCPPNKFFGWRGGASAGNLPSAFCFLPCVFCFLFTSSLVHLPSPPPHPSPIKGEGVE